MTLGMLRKFSHFFAYKIGTTLFLLGFRHRGLESHGVWHKGERNEVAVREDRGEEFITH